MENKSKKTKVIIIAIVVVVILAIIGSLAFYFLNKQQEEKVYASVYPDILSQDRYTLNEPEFGLDEKHNFELPLNSGVDLTSEYGEVGNVTSSAIGTTTTVVPGTETDEYKPVYGAARVYADASLTQEVPTNVYQINDEYGNRIEIEPNSVSCSDTSHNSIDIFHKNNADFDEFAFGRWYGYGGYYLVRYAGEDGSKLEKPEVTYFTVENDVDSEENKLASPENVECYVTEKGTLKLNWSPVEGADHYEVYLQAINPNTDGFDRYTYTRLASTKDTSFDSITIDEERNKKVIENMDGEYDTYFQNYAFDELVIGQNEDDVIVNREQAEKKDINSADLIGRVVTDYIPNEEHVKRAAVTVIAVGSGEDQQSPFKFQSINDLLNQMPLEKSSYDGEVSYKDIDPTQDPIGYMKASLYYYMLMADGTISSQQYKLDFSQVKTEQANITHGPDELHLVTEKMNRYVVPYTIENTNLSGNMEFLEMNWPRGVSQIEQATNQALEELEQSAPKAGTLQRVDVNNDDDVDWNSIQEQIKNIKPSTVKPEDVPYKVNGSTDYVKYVAANIISGSTYIDITDYYNQIGAPDIYDVYYEAIYQNPITLYISTTASPRIQKENNRTCLILDTSANAFYNTQDSSTVKELTEKRKSIDDRINQIVSTVIKDGMTDQQKVNAINDYLCNTLTYDHEALNVVENTNIAKQAAHSAEGLEDGKVVCSGYAAIFKLIADKVGINCVIATGHVQKQPGQKNNGHAWNLVNIDGTWKVVDVTWNDTDNGSNSQSDDRYLLVDQNDEVLKGRTYNRKSLLDAVVTQYVDPSLIVA